MEENPHRCQRFRVVGVFDEDDDDRYKRLVCVCEECGAETEFRRCYPKAIGEATLDFKGNFLTLPSFFEADHTPREESRWAYLLGHCTPVVDVTRFSVDASVAAVLYRWIHNCGG